MNRAPINSSGRARPTPAVGSEAQLKHRARDGWIPVRRQRRKSKQALKESRSPTKSDSIFSDPPTWKTSGLIQPTGDRIHAGFQRDTRRDADRLGTSLSDITALDRPARQPRKNDREAEQQRCPGADPNEPRPREDQYTP